ncbi:MAG: hypothetical protein K0R98_2056, partial [Rickettsiaceae bacterium]|nr:hypothetical protein [Rickettsiaceae bacterium]
KIKVQFMSRYKDEAIRLGLTRDEVESAKEVILPGLPLKDKWTDYEFGEWAIRYLRECPSDVSIHQAWENIKDVRCADMEDIVRVYRERGVTELGFTPTHVYMGRFGKEQFDAIKSGKTYKDAMPEAYKKVCELETEKAFTRGASAGVLDNILLAEIGLNVGRFLSRSDGGSLACTNKAGRDFAEVERLREKEKTQGRI